MKLFYNGLSYKQAESGMLKNEKGDKFYYVRFFYGRNKKIIKQLRR